MAQVDPRVRKASIRVECGQKAISQINGKSEQLPIIDESIIPLNSMPAFGKYRFVPCLRELGLGLWRMISSSWEFAHSEEMGTE